ncbi:MAG TPA: response regulator, partial [Myxococcales bacterium]|nr:response regulator [Myxococcales bacterium]
MPRSILLADDSVTIQQAVSMTFAAEDISVTVVGDGEEALAQAREIQPDLILADVSMPGLSGYQLCEQVRGDPGLKHIPVLLLGGGTPIDPSKAIAVGANGHMPKPFDSQKLIDQVKQILANPTRLASVARPAAPAPGARPAGPPPAGSRPPPSPASPARPAVSAGAGGTSVMPRPPMPSAPPRPAASAPPAARPAAPAPGGATRPPPVVGAPARPGSLPPPAARQA